ncbi:hypothetical protein [Spirosoma gilvum]
MKTQAIGIIFGLAFLFINSAQAQSTTGGRSGGSTASTGTGYETSGKRPAETSAASMTVADEGSQRGYLYTPPGAKPNRAASPDGSQSTKSTGQKAPSSASDSLHTRRKSTRVVQH